MKVLQKMKKNKLATLNILDLTPIRLLEHKTKNDGLIDVLVPRFKIQFLQKLIPKNRNPYINANLDELGSATWELIDGNRTATEIANILNKKIGNVEQLHQRVGLFLQKLHKNNFITFIEISSNN